MEQKIDEILTMLAELKYEIRLIGEDVKSIIANVGPQVKSIDDRVTLLENHQEAMEIELDTLARQTVREVNILKQQSMSLEFVLYGFPPKITAEQLLEALRIFGERIGETFTQAN